VTGSGTDLTFARQRESKSAQPHGRRHAGRAANLMATADGGGVVGGEEAVVRPRVRRRVQSVLRLVRDSGCREAKQRGATQCHAGRSGDHTRRHLTGAHPLCESSRRSPERHTEFDMHHVAVDAPDKALMEGTEDEVAASAAVRPTTAHFRIAGTSSRGLAGLTSWPPQVDEASAQHKRRRMDEPAATTPRTDPSDAELATREAKLAGKLEVRACCCCCGARAFEDLA